MLLLTLLLATPDAGLAVGARPAPYSFLVATGPERGQQTCYVCEQAEKPGVIVFARNLSPEVTRLAVALDRLAAGTPKATGFKVWMTHMGDSVTLDGLADWARKSQLRTTPVGVYADAAGPPAYKLAADAVATVVVFRDKKIVLCQSVRAGELTDAKVEEALQAARRAAESGEAKR